MLARKTGMPEEGILLLCTVTKIYFNSVFVHIEEYQRQGMIHISEIAPGRIRNIADYVTEGKKIICKVLRIDNEKGHIDLSLRRVNTMERRNKLDEIKQEQTAEKIIEFVASSIKAKPIAVYTTIMKAIEKKYESPYQFFLDVVVGDAQFKDFEIPSTLAKRIEELVRQRIKSPTVTIGGFWNIKSYASNGVEIIRSVLQKAMKKANKYTQLKYIGAGKYGIQITAPEYKEAEKVLKGINSVIEKGIQKPDFAEFQRKETKK